MWEGNNIKEQMISAHKDLKYTVAETLYRREIVEDIMKSHDYLLDQQSLDILVFIEITGRLSKAE